MNFIEKSGKTVEDAVQAGLKELGKASSEVNIEVLEYGSPGLFGMFGKLARVRLTVKEQNEDFDFEMPVFSLNQQTAPKTKPARRPQEKPQEKPQAQDRPQDKPREAAPLKAAARSEGVQAEGGFQAEAGKDAQEEDQIRSEAGQNRVPGQRQGARQSRQKKPRPPKAQPAPQPKGGDAPAAQGGESGEAKRRRPRHRGGRRRNKGGGEGAAQAPKSE